MPTYKGSCHCGRVTFEFNGATGPVLECNCSLCRRKGALWQATDDAHFRILAGADGLALYQFGTHTAKHYFCKHCGVSTFSHPRLAPDRWVVNLRCVDGVDLASLRIYPFDGQHWEQAAERFIKARAEGAV